MLVHQQEDKGEKKLMHIRFQDNNSLEEQNREKLKNKSHNVGDSQDLDETNQ